MLRRVCEKLPMLRKLVRAGMGSQGVSIQFGVCIRGGAVKMRCPISRGKAISFKGSGLDGPLRKANGDLTG